MKDIMIKLTGRQLNKDQNDSDLIEFITEGKAYSKRNAIYLSYEEGELSAQEKVRTTVRIGHDGQIRMKRFGHGVMLDTVMEFQKGKRFHSLYQTPYGPFEMEILTNQIINSIQPDLTGSLYIDYDISLKGLSETRNMLNIELYNPPSDRPESQQFR